MFKAKSIFDEISPNPAKQAVFLANRRWCEKFIHAGDLIFDCFSTVKTLHNIVKNGTKNFI